MGRKFTIFALFYFVFEGRNSKYKPPGGLIFGEAIKRRVFCITILGASYLEGLIHGGAYFRDLRYLRLHLSLLIKGVPTSLRDLLVRSTSRDCSIQQEKSPPGVSKCNYPSCLTCPFLKQGQANYTFTSSRKRNDIYTTP